jgi:hypothetical protein
LSSCLSACASPHAWFGKTTASAATHISVTKNIFAHLVITCLGNYFLQVYSDPFQSESLKLMIYWHLTKVGLTIGKKKPKAFLLWAFWWSQKRPWRKSILL